MHNWRRHIRNIIEIDAQCKKMSDTGHILNTSLPTPNALIIEEHKDEIVVETR